MWLLIESLLVKYALPDVLELLVKAGFMSALHAEGIEDVASLKLFIDELKFTYTYPTDKNGDGGETPHSTSNINPAT